MEKEDQVITLDKMFSKWFLKDKGKNKTADFFADDLWNLRIKNKGITPRLGTELIYDWDDPNEIQWIVTNNSGRLYVAQDWHLREIDYTADPVTDTDLWDMNAVGKVRFITYGIYTIILTEWQLPWLYDWTILTQLTNTHVPTGTNPTFGTRFAGFTVIQNVAKPNTILISRPITTANQEYCYDYTHADAETLTFDSTVWWVIGTLNNLRVFTDTTVEYMGKDNLSNVGGIASLFTIPLGAWYQLASPDSVCSGWDVLFFLTKNKKIWTINYKATVTQPQIAIISDIEGNSIDGFMQDNLADDQSDAVAAFDRKQNIVKFYVKSRNSTVNDICVIYDIQNETWLKDDNKYVSCVTSLNDELYSWSAFSYKVQQEEIGDSDSWEAIYAYFETTDIVVWSPADVKQFRWMQLAGQINNQSLINVQILVDENPAFDKVIDGSTIAINTLSLGLGGSPNGWEPIWGRPNSMLEDLVDFEKVVNVWGLRKTWKKIKVIFQWEEVAQNWIIDFLSLVVRPRARPRYKDVL